MAGQPVTNPNHPIQGGGYIIPDLKFLDQVPVDGFIQVSGNEAEKTTKELAKYEGPPGAVGACLRRRAPARRRDDGEQSAGAEVAQPDLLVPSRA